MQGFGNINAATVGTGPSSRKQAATDAGLSKRQADAFLRVENIAGPGHKSLPG